MVGLAKLVNNANNVYEEVPASNIEGILEGATIYFLEELIWIMVIVHLLYYFFILYFVNPVILFRPF